MNFEMECNCICISAKIIINTTQYFLPVIHPAFDVLKEIVPFTSFIGTLFNFNQWFTLVGRACIRIANMLFSIDIATEI